MAETVDVPGGGPIGSGPIGGTPPTTMGDTSLAGTITCTATLTGELVGSPIALAGTIEATASLFGDLTSIVGLAGTITCVAVLTGELNQDVALFATYDLYINDTFYAVGVIDDVSIPFELSETYTGTRDLGSVTVRIGVGSDPDLAKIYKIKQKGSGMRLYQYDTKTLVKTLVWDGIFNSIGLDERFLILNGVPAPVSVLEQKVPSVLIDTTWPKAFGSGAGKAIDIGEPIPDVIGNVPRVKAVCINEDLFTNTYDYALFRGSGNNVTAMYRSLSGSGEKAQASLITASEYTISTTFYPGYTVARFPVRQESHGGGLHTIYADVATPLSQDITRNPARVIRTYLTEAGQTCVAASFDAAEAEYTRLGYVVDFALIEQRPLQDIFSNLQLMLDSVLARTSVGWTLDVDVRPTTVDYEFAEGPDVEVPTILEIGPREMIPLLNDFKRVVLKYLPDMLDPATYLGTVTREVRAANTASDLELTFPEIREWSVADKIADYKAKQLRARWETITVRGPRASPSQMRKLVSITSPRRSMDKMIWMIRASTVSLLGTPQLECVPWSPDPYIYEAGVMPTDVILGSFDDFSRIPPPVIQDVTFPAGAPYEGVEIGAGGAVKAFITMRFVTPTGGNYAFAVVRYRTTSTTLWVPAGGPITQIGTVDVKIRNLEPETSYDFSVQSFNQWGLTAGGE